MRGGAALSVGEADTDTDGGVAVKEGDGPFADRKSIGGVFV